jgi:hypothetical protein
MNTRRLHSFTRKFALWLGFISALYLLLIAGTGVALNHKQALRLEQRHISRVWLLPNYQPEAGYDVPTDVVLRDINSSLLFGPAGARVLDTLLLLWIVAGGFAVGVQMSEHRQAPEPIGVNAARNAIMRAPLQKAAPYGDSGRRATRGKVLEFHR